MLALSNSKKKKRKKERKERKEKTIAISLTLILWIPSVILSTRFENKLVVNFVLLINFIL